jgi:hypothetical protein
VRRGSREHRSWLTSVRFADRASRATLADYLHAHDVLIARRDQIEADLAALAHRPVRAHGRAAAVPARDRHADRPRAFAEIGEWEHFDHHNQLASYSGSSPQNTPPFRSDVSKRSPKPAPPTPFTPTPDTRRVAAARMLAALTPGGALLIAQGSREGHYLRFYRHFLDDLREGARPRAPRTGSTHTPRRQSRKSPQRQLARLPGSWSSRQSLASKPEPHASHRRTARDGATNCPQRAGGASV